MDCPECGQKAEPIENKLTVPAFGITVSQKGYLCPRGTCHEIFYTSQQCLDADLEVATLLMKRAPERKAFRYVRHALGMTNLETANTLGVRYGMVSRWENGTRKISLRVWKLLAEKVKAKRAT